MSVPERHHQLLSLHAERGGEHQTGYFNFLLRTHQVQSSPAPPSIHIGFALRDKFALPRFVIDVVRPRKDDVVLVDFNPWGETTDSLMFSWQELADCPHSDHMEFRFTFSK